MHFLQAINSDLSVFTVCNKTAGTIKGDIKKIIKNKNQSARVEFGNYHCSHSVIGN